MRPAYRTRQIVNALNLSTLLGLLVAKLLHARLERAADGLVLARDAGGTFPRASAFTIGNVIVLREPHPSDELLRHESHHSTQWAWCVLVFLPLYLLAAAWSWSRAGDHWSRNWFERHAGLADGGYRENPLRAVWTRRP